MEQQYPSLLLERAVGEFSKLPGIGRKTALRLVLHLLRQPAEEVEKFAHAIAEVRNEIKYCKVCHNISDTDVCQICSDKRRDKQTICVVENARDVYAMERIREYHGLYHVLHGVINPAAGIGAQDIRLKELMLRLHDDCDELIIATNSSVEGEATAMYISKMVKPAGIKCSRIATGVPVGGDLECTDEVTLLRALDGRVEL